MEDVKVQGKKFDAGRLRFDLLPTKALMELVKVYTVGAVKYADRNWEAGIDYGRIFAAMQRHAWKFWHGEEYDVDDGQHHLASVAWCALALLEYQLRGEYEQHDNRPRKEDVPERWR